MRILSLTTVFFAAAMTTGGAFARLPNLDSISIGAAQISNEMPNAAPLASNLEKRNHHNSGVDVNSASATGDVMVSHRRRHGHQSGHRAGGRTRNASLRNGHRRHRNQRNANRGEMTPFDRLMNLLHRATSLIQRSAGRTGERGVGHRRHRHQRNRAAGGHRHHGGRRHRGVGGRNRSGRGGAGRQPVPWQYHRNVKKLLKVISKMVDLAQKETQHPGRRMRNLRSGGRHMRSGRRHHSGRRHQTGAAADRPNLAELPAAAAIVSPITSA